MNVKIKLLNEKAKIPSKTYENDFCYDVVATSRHNYGDGRIEYGLGFCLQHEKPTHHKDIEFHPDTLFSFDFRARSSIHKTGLILSNCVGTGDEAYTVEYKAVFYHVIPSLKPYEVGDRILQIKIGATEKINFIEVEELNETERGDKGYGSTGK